MEVNLPTNTENFVEIAQEIRHSLQIVYVMKCLEIFKFGAHVPTPHRWGEIWREVKNLKVAS